MTDNTNQPAVQEACANCAADVTRRDNALEPMLTTQEVIDFLQVTKDTLYAWRSTGDGPTAHKFGKHLRFHRHDLLAFVAANKVA
ncbi:helix-turn-helix domain-containing protein [Nocardioides sp. NPDC092400]|uniref:helix-turn-helix domain-containing protein n=1 Tax=Nocardioides sp. NPDC092400 TaxID=3155196 RepID=UPI00341BADA9